VWQYARQYPRDSLASSCLFGRYTIQIQYNTIFVIGAWKNASSCLYALVINWCVSSIDSSEWRQQWEDFIETSSTSLACELDIRESRSRSQLGPPRLRNRLRLISWTLFSQRLAVNKSPLSPFAFLVSQSENTASRHPSVESTRQPSKRRQLLQVRSQID